MSFLKALPTALTVLLAATATSAFAAGNLTPGTTIVPTDVGSVVNPAQFVAVDLEAFASPADAKNPYSGTLGSFVEDEGAANPLGGLTFLYGITNDPTSTVPLASLAVNGFAGFDTSAYYDSQDGGAVSPNSAHRTLDGDTIKFFFLDANGNEAIMPGDVTFLTVVRTNAHDYVPILDGIRDGVETNAFSFGPAPVPEASTTVSFGLLLMLGLGGVVLAARKNKVKAPA